MTGPGSDKTYTYTVSLRIWHPHLTTDEISAAVSLTPRAPRVASPQSTKSTFWTAALEHDPSVELAPFLKTVTQRLQPHASFFETLRASQGRAELFVGWFLNGNTGEVLPHTLLRSIAGLGLDLAVDVYPPDEPRTLHSNARVAE